MNYNPIPHAVRAIYDFWLDVFGRVFLEPARLGTFGFVQPRNRFPREVYLRALIWNGILWILIPGIVLVVNEHIGDLRPVTAWVGLFLGLSLCWFGWLAVPIGVAIDELTMSVEGVGSRYVKFIKDVLFVELVLAMYLWVLPFSTARSLFPIFALVALAAALGYNRLGGNKKGFTRFSTKLAMVFIVLFVVALFLPQTGTAASDAPNRLDNTLALQVTCLLNPDKEECVQARTESEPADLASQTAEEEETAPVPTTNELFYLSRENSTVVWEGQPGECSPVFTAGWSRWFEISKPTREMWIYIDGKPIKYGPQSPPIRLGAAPRSLQACVPHSEGEFYAGVGICAGWDGGHGRPYHCSEFLDSLSAI